MFYVSIFFLDTWSYIRGGC